MDAHKSVHAHPVRFILPVDELDVVVALSAVDDVALRLLYVEQPYERGINDKQTPSEWSFAGMRKGVGGGGIHIEKRTTSAALCN